MRNTSVVFQTHYPYCMILLKNFIMSVFNFDCIGCINRFFLIVNLKCFFISDLGYTVSATGIYQILHGV